MRGFSPHEQCVLDLRARRAAHASALFAIISHITGRLNRVGAGLRYGWPTLPDRGLSE
jgi:hypothetical protein